MGTSSTFGGPSGTTPLVPSWLSGDAEAGDGVPPTPLPLPTDPNRFSSARGNFSRFASSGGRDRAGLGRAVSQYVSTATGGSKIASSRMGASRHAASRLLIFLSDVVARGPREALRALNLEDLAGRPIEDIFIGLTDYVCPEAGSVDDGIARDAFIETIVDLAVAGVTDLAHLTTDQVQAVFELYATNAIEVRLLNDIGGKAISFPSDSREAHSVQAQLHDFIRRGVSDALTAARTAAQALTADNVLSFVGRIYRQTFEILQVLGEAEARLT